MEGDHDLTQGKIVPQLVGFALPVLPALFLQTMYGAVGLMLVGRLGGELANVYVSAVSTGSRIMQTVTVAITGPCHRPDGLRGPEHRRRDMAVRGPDAASHGRIPDKF